MWKKDLMMTLLCTTTMNMEVIEPTLVILVGTWALLFLLGSLLGILVLNVLYLNLYIFAVVLLSLIRKWFLEGFPLSHSLAM